MTSVYITIDTEYSAGLAASLGLEARQENFARSISCATASGAVGIFFKMDLLERYGLKAVFFVDPMPALVWGVEAITDIVGPIIECGHDVQLHLHAEWLQLAGEANPLGKRTGRNIADFTFQEQCLLLEYARDTLVSAGAPAPVAFRAGNYGANDDTLRALAAIGLAYDTSHCPGIANSECRISLGPGVRHPIEHCGVIEVPIGCVGQFRDGLRHAQITALTAREMLAAIQHARHKEIGNFTLVSHSFELLGVKRQKINRIVRRRFETLCRGIARIEGIATATYRDNPPLVVPANDAPQPVMPFSPWRTGLRFAEQAAVTMLYR